MNKSDRNKLILRNIAYIAMCRGYNATKIHYMTGINKNAVSSILNQRYKMTDYMIGKICEAFHITIEELTEQDWRKLY